MRVKEKNIHYYNTQKTRRNVKQRHESVYGIHRHWLYIIIKTNEKEGLIVI